MNTLVDLSFFTILIISFVYTPVCRLKSMPIQIFSLLVEYCLLEMLPSFIVSPEWVYCFLHSAGGGKWQELDIAYQHFYWLQSVPLYGCL